MEEDNNIIFSLIEKQKNNDDFVDIEKLLGDFNNDNSNNIDNDFIFAIIKNYDINFTVKQLITICDYYGLLKQIKNNKLKKIDYINMIVLFEIEPSNFNIVHTRQKYWNYMKELQSDKFMKKYILW